MFSNGFPFMFSFNIQISFTLPIQKASFKFSNIIPCFAIFPFIVFVTISFNICKYLPRFLIFLNNYIYLSIKMPIISGKYEAGYSYTNFFKYFFSLASINALCTFSVTRSIFFSKCSAYNLLISVTIFLNICKESTKL